jgi:hypothetical protein
VTDELIKSEREYKERSDAVFYWGNKRLEEIRTKQKRAY